MAGEGVDRFGNLLAPGLPYARGTILRSTEDDVTKLREAWRLIRTRIDKDGPETVFNFTGLERQLHLAPSDLPFADDELGAAMFGERLTELALEHLGGTPARHDVMLFNRMTAATLAVHFVLVESGDTVVALSAAYSHPTVGRAAARVGARFVDTATLEAFARALDAEPRVRLVVLTRLATTYEALDATTLREAVRLAHARGARVYVDDAGGARVGPVVFDQPRMLELGVDVGATGLDKYGTVGPRLGLLAGEKTLVATLRARAFEFGLEARPLLYPAAVRSLEQYAPARVRALVATTKEVEAALQARLGARVHVTPVTAQLLAEDILAVALERAGLETASIVPYEAMAALAMLLLRDHGMLTIHLAALPPGARGILIKFVPPETLARFGGAARFAEAVDRSLDALAALVGDPAAVRALILGVEA
jgi:L-seryl-tRNA(Ser) seleniumtransferase